MKRNVPIVVTGANGLAGSAVVKHLRDELFTAVVPITRKDVDLRDHRAVHDLFERIGGERGPFYVFHAAATVYGLGGNMRNQAKSFLDNTLINTAVIDAAHRSGCMKLIAMGTNAAYPFPCAIPYHEADMWGGRPHDGERGYGDAKRHMLAMLQHYHADYGMEYAYLISGNLYGPRDRFDAENGHVLPSLIKKFRDALDTGGTVEVWGDGCANRDFLYSADLADIVQRMLSPDIRSTAINIGSGEVHPIWEVVQLLCKITGLPADRVRWNTEKPNGRLNCASDLSRLRDLGFTPRFSLEKGLTATWAWFNREGRAK